jgi:acyl carrier protein
MSSAEILETLKALMIDVFDLDDVAVTEQTTAEDIEEWDSLSHVRLMVAIERKFGFRFTNSEIEALSNVGDLVKIIESKVS